MSKIHKLTEDLKNKIAAGEVVEWPASVVKEMMENSIDAGAKEIEVIVSGGGNASIKVIDNGEGIDKEEIGLAFQRHSTSKLFVVDDLMNIHTLGFRGEALASISSVARVKAGSSTNGSGMGYEVDIHDGVVSDPVPASLSRGTSITVQDLFYSIPARRKFLKGHKVELRHIIQTIRRFALCYPRVTFKLISDNKPVLNLTPETLEDRISSVFDPSYKNHLLPVKFEKDAFKVTGFVGDLSLVRKRRGEQHLFLNKRYIVNNLLNSSCYSAYQPLVSRGEYPFFVLNLQMPLDGVDVNVHPMKIEVRFRDEWRIYHVLKSAVTEGLKDILSTIPDFSPVENVFQDGGQSPEIPFQINRPPHLQTESQKGDGTGVDVERAKEYVESFSTRAEEIGIVDLEHIWQIHSKYIVSQIKSGLVIIDQHVAHERILFEQALAAMNKEPMPSQSLLFPKTLEFPPDDFSVLLELFPYLQKLGFRMREFGKYAVVIEGVPSEMGWGNEQKILKEVIDNYQTHHKEYPSFQEALAASFACRAAVKAGDSLLKREMQTLVDRLFGTEHPYYCPHGRPVIINLTLDELDKRFERK